MAPIVWVACPECKGQFYCKAGDFEDSLHSLLCPYCGKGFFFKDSPRISK